MQFKAILFGCKDVRLSCVQCFFFISYINYRYINNTNVTTKRIRKKTCTNFRYFFNCYYGSFWQMNWVLRKLFNGTVQKR